MTAELTTVTVSAGVAHLCLNRPHVSNALDLAAAESFAVGVRRAGADDVGAVLISGAGPRFCVGGDLAAMRASSDPSAYVMAMASALDEALVALTELDKPVVAAVQGAVAGAGLGVMLSADVVVAAAQTRFSAAYSRMGLTPDCGVSYGLAQAIGLHRALGFVLLDRTINAATAHEWGLVTQIVEQDPVAAATHIAQTWADGPRSALGRSRQLVRRSATLGRAASGQEESRSIATAAAFPEAQRRMDEFFGQRRS